MFNFELNYDLNLSDLFIKPKRVYQVAFCNDILFPGYFQCEIFKCWDTKYPRKIRIVALSDLSEQLRNKIKEGENEFNSEELDEIITNTKKEIND